MALRFDTGFRSPRWAAALLLAGLIAVRQHPVTAADNPPSPKKEAQPGSTAKNAIASTGSPAAIDGFRDARFGMSEEQVRAVIRRDFPSAAASLTSTINPSEKTTVLSETVPDLLPHTGKARISYIFGYRSRRLIQVNLVWISDRSAAADETVVGTANALRDYFATENFAPNSVVANRQLAANTILVFRGVDEQKRTVLLVLSGVAGAARAADKTSSRWPPLTLELSYIADPAHPDVFRIGKGQF